ncbi:hypothetical protein CR513_12024, partial [Mucuna pruriens]
MGDIVMTSSDQEAISRIKHMLHSTFHLKELGYLTFLGFRDSQIQPLLTLPLKLTLNIDEMKVTILMISLYKLLVSSCNLHNIPFFNMWFIFLANSFLNLQAYSGVNSAGCPDTRKSTFATKYCAMSTTCSEIKWLRGLLTKLGFPQAQSTPLHVDNTSVKLQQI